MFRVVYRMRRLVMHRVMMMDRSMMHRFVVHGRMMRIMMVLRHRHTGHRDKSKGN
jgi:hypothetical protein